MGYTNEVEELVASRLKLVHGDAFEAVEILNNRLRILGQDTCSSLHTKGSVAASILNDEKLKEGQLCTQLGSNDHLGENSPPSNELGAREGAKPAIPPNPIFPRSSLNCR